MPIYSYKCQECDEAFDARKDIEDRDTAECKCGGEGKKTFAKLSGVYHPTRSMK